MGEVEQFCKPSCISSTNWIVSKGSIDDSISFETPISSINDEHDDFHDSKSLKHQPVILIPSSSSDSSPCEIKLSFEQRHEIRQVYVRSTARTYEIYYAIGPERSNEYLCTVRCGIAAKEDVSISISDSEVPSFAHMRGSDDRKELLEHGIKTGSNSSADEDGWVEVKVPDSALSDSKVKGNSVIKNTERSNQDFYEATAEITDSNPCISITLRLLSLHTKGCIHLEEIYIFGEPVDPTESDGKVDLLKRSEQSSMMAMLVPTLLQLSKTGMMKKAEEKHVSNVRHELKPPEDESVGPSVGSTSQKEAHPSLANQKEVNVEPVQGTGQGPGKDSSSSRMEKVLDQLISRVGQIEAFCSRFEENMLKPIGNIESRLERIEQQMEVLTTRSQVPEFYPSTRISAPDFSIIESETNSLQNGEPSSPQNASESVVDYQLFPNLKVTAPEFSDQDENDDSSGSENDSVVYIPKPSLSLDDSIAMALAGFMSSSTSEPPKVNHPWTVEAPDFPDDDNGGNDDSSRCLTTDAVDGSCCDKTINGDSDEEDEDVEVEVDNYNSYGFPILKTCQVTDASTEAIDGSCDDRSLNQTICGEDSDEECPIVSSTDALIRGFTVLEEGEDDTSVNQSVTGNSDELNEEDSNIYQSMKGEDVKKWLVANPGDNRDEVVTMLDQNSTPIVDFELPVLDVKFERRGDMNSGYSLESLLSEVFENAGENSDAKDDNSSVAIYEPFRARNNQWFFDNDALNALTFEDYIGGDNKVEDSCVKFDSENGSDQFVADNDSLIESDDVVSKSEVMECIPDTSEKNEGDSGVKSLPSLSLENKEEFVENDLVIEVDNVGITEDGALLDKEEKPATLHNHGPGDTKVDENFSLAERKI